MVTSVKPFVNLNISFETTPVIMAVVVAMAGMILPAIRRDTRMYFLYASITIALQAFAGTTIHCRESIKQIKETR